MLRNRGPTLCKLQFFKDAESIAYLDGLGIQLQPLFLVREEILNILTLIALKLDYLAHLRINNDGAIASC